MHVVSFDMDGTLVASADFDGAMYAEAVRHVLGVDIGTDWSRYENVTDSGILDEILEERSRPISEDVVFLGLQDIDAILSQLGV